LVAPAPISLSPPAITFQRWTAGEVKLTEVQVSQESRPGWNGVQIFIISWAEADEFIF
jgi:hypothetical protein